MDSEAKRIMEMSSDFLLAPTYVHASRFVLLYLLSQHFTGPAEDMRSERGKRKEEENYVFLLNFVTVSTILEACFHSCMDDNVEAR